MRGCLLPVWKRRQWDCWRLCSDIVTREMLFTDLVEYVSLKEPIEKWVEAFERQIKREFRKESPAMRSRGAASLRRECGRRMEALYEELLAEK